MNLCGEIEEINEKIEAEEERVRERSFAAKFRRRQMVAS